MVRGKNQKLLEEVANAIQDKKGANIIGIDVRSFSTLTGYFLVAEGTVSRHVKAMAKHVIDLLAENEMEPFHVEGMEFGDWIVLDYGDFIIHLMQEEMREKYRLEEIWKKGKIVPLNLKIFSEVR
jgi:ribosome-associated protein